MVLVRAMLDSFSRMASSKNLKFSRFLFVFHFDVFLYHPRLFLRRVYNHKTF